MSQIGMSIAVLYWVSLIGVALAFYAIFRTRERLPAGSKSDDPRWALHEAAIESLRAEIAACARQMREIEQVAAPPLPKPGLNLTKRSQALRMHRRGEQPERIAAALEVPHQEIELLLKVHQIVVGDL